MSADSRDRKRTSPLRVSFPGGAAVEARYRGFTIRTDQPERQGGAASAPPPFDLFLASIATCAGYYALEFLRRRDLSTDGLALELEPLRGDDGKRIATLRIRIALPAGFPAKYRQPLERAVDQCAVKRHIVDPPRFETLLDD